MVDKFRRTPSNHLIILVDIIAEDFPPLAYIPIGAARADGDSLGMVVTLAAATHHNSPGLGTGTGHHCVRLPEKYNRCWQSKSSG